MKKIIIPTEGFIESKGVYGPVLSPYMETDKEIMKMLARGIEVKEVREEGELYKLSVSDLYQKKEHTNDNNKNIVMPKPQPVNDIVNCDVTKRNSTNYISKKDKKKNKNKHNKNQELGFEIDILESK